MPDCRLIYRSIAEEAVLDKKSLQELEAKCVERNTAADISGMLILSGEHFLQVLEGDSDRVNELYAKIVSDPRHRAVRLITFEPITERYFSEWGMRLIDLYNLPMEPRRFLMKKYSSDEDAVFIPNQLNLVYSLLLDAKTFCASQPWSQATGSLV